MGPIWGRQDPGGPHVGPMNLAIWGACDPNDGKKTKQNTETRPRDLYVLYIYIYMFLYFYFGSRYFLRRAGFLLVALFIPRCASNVILHGVGVTRKENLTWMHIVTPSIDCNRQWKPSTQWGLVMRIYVSQLGHYFRKCFAIGHQAITWANVDFKVAVAPPGQTLVTFDI